MVPVVSVIVVGSVVVVNDRFGYIGHETVSSSSS